VRRVTSCLMVDPFLSDFSLNNPFFSIFFEYSFLLCHKDFVPFKTTPPIVQNADTRMSSRELAHQLQIPMNKKCGMTHDPSVLHESQRTLSHIEPQKSPVSLQKSPVSSAMSRVSFLSLAVKTVRNAHTYDLTHPST